MSFKIRIDNNCNCIIPYSLKYGTTLKSEEIKDNDKFQIKSEFNKTVVEDLHIVHNGADLSVSSKFSSVDTSILNEYNRAVAKENALQSEYTTLVKDETTRAIAKEDELANTISANEELHNLALDEAVLKLGNLISEEKDKLDEAKSLFDAGLKSLSVRLDSLTETLENLS